MHVDVAGCCATSGPTLPDIAPVLREAKAAGVNPHAVSLCVTATRWIRVRVVAACEHHRIELATLLDDVTEGRRR